MATEEISNSVEVLQLEAQPVLSIRGTVPVERLGEAMGERIGALSDYARQHGIQPAGPFYVRYHSFGEVETDMETGIPVTQTIGVGADSGQVVAGELPGGPAIATSHFGPHQNLGEAYARISEWIKAHDLQQDGPSWEVYHWVDLAHPDLQTDPSKWGTQLIQPIK